MKSFVLVESGLAQYCVEEVKRILGVDAQVNGNVVEFESSNILKFVAHTQTARRVLFAVDKNKKIKDLVFDSFNWEEVFPSSFVATIEVENVKGQENRSAISHELAVRLVPFLKEKGIEVTLDYKKPEIRFIVYHNEGIYCLGVDLCSKELNKREYRVFAHSGGFKGDVGYFFVRKSGFSVGESLLVGFAKDGTLGIEAGLFVFGRELIDMDDKSLSFHKFKGLSQNIDVKDNDGTIVAFDEAMGNLTAMRKNVVVAGLKEKITTRKLALDDLDVSYKESFDRVIFHVTSKDEVKINEMYYQLNYVLKKGGTVLFIGREHWEVPVSSKYKLVEKGGITRGDNTHTYALLRKK